MRYKILVCGGRDFTDYQKMSAELNRIIIEKGWVSPDDFVTPNVEIISGCAKGADSLAIDWAIVNWVSWEEFPANWSKFGKGAGHIRNQQMLDEGKPDLVVAFPGGRGTADMVRRAKLAGVEVIEV